MDSQSRACCESPAQPRQRGSIHSTRRVMEQSNATGERCNRCSAAFVFRASTRDLVYTARQRLPSGRHPELLDGGAARTMCFASSKSLTGRLVAVLWLEESLIYPGEQSSTRSAELSPTMLAKPRANLHHGVDMAFDPAALCRYPLTCAHRHDGPVESRGTTLSGLSLNHRGCSTSCAAVEEKMKKIQDEKKYKVAKYMGGPRYSSCATEYMRWAYHQGHVFRIKLTTCPLGMSRVIMNTSRLVGSPISPLFIANRLVTVVTGQSPSATPPTRLNVIP